LDQPGDQLGQQRGLSRTAPPGDTDDAHALNIAFLTRLSGGFAWLRANVILRREARSAEPRRTADPGYALALRGWPAVKARAGPTTVQAGQHLRVTARSDPPLLRRGGVRGRGSRAAQFLLDPERMVLFGPNLVGVA